MRVVVHGHRNRAGAEETAAQVRAAGSEALVVMGDLGNRAEVGAMAAQALAAFGSIDVLVNNAAIRPETPLEELGEEDWHHVFSVNLHSACVLTKAFVPEMKRKGWGRVVYFTGMNAMHGYSGPISTEHPDDPAMASHIASLVGRIPLGRLGTPQEVAALCGHLCSREGGYISGQMIACNGAGQT